jgi:adenylosuccinate lyase
MVDELRPHVSEYGLMHNRTRVEAAWLITLVDRVDTMPALPDRARGYLGELASGASFSGTDMAATKDHEAKTRHDVKAVELMLRDRLDATGLMGDHLELIHFGLTSEDVNNLADGIGWREARDEVILPVVDSIIDDLAGKADASADLPMLSHTHGQPATPTTLGKEMAVFGLRIAEAAEQLGDVCIKGKLNGATGNYNALRLVYPEIDWQAVSRAFVESLGLTFNPLTTQIEPHDWMAQYLHGLSGISYPLVDLARDIWTYVSLEYLSQKKVEGEVGSSTMPHKINPIDFEKAEANFDTAITMSDGLARKLTASRLQRDLSDSSSKRTAGTILGHDLVALKSLKRGLGRIEPNPTKLASDLGAHWEILTEPVQQMLRRYGVAGGYDAMKAVSRGEVFGESEYAALVNELSLPDEARDTLLNLTPHTYIGDAPQLARNFAESRFSGRARSQDR